MPTATPLPPALRPWHPWLGWFSGDMVDALGEMLVRLDPLLGRFRDRNHSGSGEPDGVEDLHRRGPYERLLSTEWLLASDLPDEFIRRAVVGEHLFLAPRPRARRAQRLIVALFDAGPWQLGSPRLVHVAWWILLARRAAAAGGDFRWGLLQRPGELHAAGTAADLQALLRARSFTLAGRPQALAWREWLGDQFGDALGECWHVGRAALPDAPATHVVSVTPMPWLNALDVRLVQGAVERSARLPLPEGDAPLRLLKGRFDQAPAPSRFERCAPLSLRFAPVISDAGDRVAVPLLSEPGILLFRLPKESGKGVVVPGRKLQWTVGAEPLAASFRGKQFGMLMSLPGNQLQFWQVHPQISPRPPREAFEASPGVARWLPCAVLRPGKAPEFHVLDAAGRLVWWVLSKERRGPMLLQRNVLAMIPVALERIVYVAEEDGVLWARSAHLGLKSAMNVRLGPGAARAVVFMGSASRWHTGFGGCAVGRPEDGGGVAWEVLEATSNQNLAPDGWRTSLANGTAIGLVPMEDTASSALVTLHSARRQLSLVQSSGTRPLFTAPAPIERHSVCPHSGTVALLTRERQLIVLCTREGRVRLTVQGGGDGDAAAA